MRKTVAFVLITLLAALAAPARADVAAEDMARARNQLMQGNIENAIRLLQDMQVEAPDSPYIQFGLGEAYSQAPEQAVDTGDIPSAVGYLESARRAFDAAGQSPAPDTLHANAHYNAANAMTRMGELLALSDQYQGAVQQLHGALETYDIALSREPGHTAALHNRAYARWTLKQLLMEEPPPEEQPQPPPEGDAEDEEGEDEQEQEPQPDGDEEEEPDAPEGEDEQEQDDSPGDEEGPEPPMPSPDQPQDQPEEPEDMEMQEFEALLDNLMDIDDEEQRNMRREQRTQQQIREWW